MNKLNQYIISSIGNTESIIDIKLLKFSHKIESHIFLNEYKISNFFRGKFFIKRLLNKIFKHKLNDSMMWNQTFWKQIEINCIEVSLNFKNKKFQQLSILEKLYTKKRMKAVYKYKDLINNSRNFSPPLYIEGKCLNNLGANVNPNEIFMLDGSRRLLANLLSENDLVNIYLISN